MESTNISHWTIDAELPHQLSNYSADLVNNTDTQRFAIRHFSVLIMCILGLPGNLFIFAVYVVKMTSSTRVYMFALAIADSAVCVSGIVLSVGYTDTATNFIFIEIIDVSTAFSVLLLTFVSIERFLAIIRPHTFSLHPLRAKKSLGFITLVTCIFETLLRIVAFTGNIHVFAILVVAMILSCSSVMVTCYTLIAVSLLQRARASRVKIGVINRTYSSPQPGTSKQHQATTSTGVSPNLHLGETTSVAVTKANKATAVQAKSYRGVLLLFLITMVFICSLLPECLSNAGVSIPTYIRQLILVNSIANPYIYGFASPMFMEDVRYFFRQIRNWLTACCH